MYTFKLRMKNRYAIASSIVLLFFVFISWLFGSELIQIFFSYGEDVSSEFTYWEYIVFMMDVFLNWELCIDSAMRYICVVFPLFACIPILNFVEELNSYYVLGNTRWKSQIKPIIKGVMCYTVLGGFVTIVPLLLFITLVNYLMYPSLENIGGLVSIFPEGFYVQHPYLTFFFMIAILYLLLSMSFALMACDIALLTEKKILVVIIPVIFYMIENGVAYFLGGTLAISTLDVVTSFNTLRSTQDLFFPILVQYGISGILLILSIMKYNRKSVRG